MSAVADVLNGAADLIERDGWCQAQFRGPNGEHCVSDALMRAAGTKPGDTGSGEQRDIYSRACWFLTAGSITAWNDERSTTKAEVVAALRAAAERAA